MSTGPAAARTTIEQITSRTVLHLTALTGGCIAEVYRVDFADGGPLVAKLSSDGGLALEGRMLRDLARLSALPLPQVRHSEEQLLLLSFIEGGDRLDPQVEHHAAELLANLHAETAEAYGFAYDTLVGPLPQPNPWSADWCRFYREQRLWPMAERAAAAGHLPGSTKALMQRLCDRLDDWIDPPAQPSLIHGDIWSGNVLARDGRIVGLLDPAVYYADAEIELAFIALFSTFGGAFFQRYQEHRPLRPEFWETRCPLYQLYPLLVHATLFGGHYPAAVERIARRFVG